MKYIITLIFVLAYFGSTWCEMSMVVSEDDDESQITTDAYSMRSIIALYLHKMEKFNEKINGLLKENLWNVLHDLLDNRKQSLDALRNNTMHGELLLQTLETSNQLSKEFRKSILEDVGMDFDM